MKILLAVVTAAFGVVNAHPAADIERRAPAGLPGMDVSAGQGNVDWAAAKANGAQFAYIKVSLHFFTPLNRSNTCPGN
jgi:GH25 family lysozyme M1 (1,4-beta-N-acetylmuramidase)